MLARRLRLLSLPLVLGACTSQSLRLDEPYTAPVAREVEVRSEFVPGDTLEVEYSRNYPAIQAYLLGVGDQVEIEVFRHPELSLATTVAPDGTISFHQVGTLKAAGTTIEDLRVRVTEAMAGLFPDPVVSVFLKQSDMRVARFLELLLSHPSGALRQVTVDQSGTIALPGIGRMSIAGLTAEQVQDQFNERLQASLPTLSVFVTSKRQAGDVFTVLGEVTKPGRFAMEGEYTLVEALAVAGGGTRVADLSRVVVMNYPVGSEPAVARLYDVNDAFAHGQLLAGVRIRPRDTVFVLRTGIGDLNEAIDLYIRKNIPINVGVTYRIDAQNNGN